MTTVPPSLRRLFWAGGNALRTVREFHGAAESCRGLLEVDGHRQLLAAGTAYSPLFDCAAAGNPLGGVTKRLAERVEQSGGRHGLRARSRRGPALEAGAAIGGELTGGREVAHVTRAAAATSGEFIRATRRETADAQAPGRAMRSTRRGSDLAPPVVPPGGRRAAPGGADSEGLERPAAGPGAPGRAGWRGAATVHQWTGEDAARELAVRADRAGLSEAWSRPAAAPAFAVIRPARVVASPIIQAVAARLEPLVETIAWRDAHLAPLARERRMGGVEPTAEEHASASTPFHPEATTPLRRLAARGRVREAVPAHAADSPMVSTLRPSRAAARLTSPPRGHVVEARGRLAPEQPRPEKDESRDLAEMLGDVLYREALRHGIDPLEYES